MNKLHHRSRGARKSRAKLFFQKLITPQKQKSKDTDVGKMPNEEFNILLVKIIGDFKEETNRWMK